MTALEGQLSLTQEESTNLRATLRANEESLQRSASEQSEQAQTKIAALTKSLSEAQNALAITKSQLEQVTVEKEGESRGVVELQQQFAKEAEETRAQVESVQNDLSQAQEAVAEKHSALLQVTQEKESLQQLLDEAREQQLALLQQHQEEIAQLQLAQAELIRSHELSQSAAAEETSKATAEFQELLNSLQTDLEATQTELANAKAQPPPPEEPEIDYAALQADLDSLTRQFTSLEERHRQTESELTSARSALETAEIENEQLALALESEDRPAVGSNVTTEVVPAFDVRSRRIWT